MVIVIIHRGLRDSYIVRVFATRCPSGSLSVMNVSSFAEGLLSRGTSPSAITILTVNKNRFLSTFSGTGGPWF